MTVNLFLAVMCQAVVFLLVVSRAALSSATVTSTFAQKNNLCSPTFSYYLLKKCLPLLPWLFRFKALRCRVFPQIPSR